MSSMLSLINFVFRSFFKKWLELERRLGDEEGATVVKQKAVEWTQRAANDTSTEQAEQQD